MIPEICSVCKGKVKQGFTEFIAKVNDQIIVISDIPAWVCVNCDTAYFTHEISKKIDIIMEKVHNNKFVAKPLAAGKIQFSDITPIEA